jgi:hypothetical protein
MSEHDQNKPNTPELNRSKSLIRELYMLSENGAFDNVDVDTAETACEMLMSFMNPKLTYKQAAKVFGMDEKVMLNHIQRKIPEKDREKDGLKKIAYMKIKKVLKRKGE